MKTYLKYTTNVIYKQFYFAFPKLLVLLLVLFSLAFSVVYFDKPNLKANAYTI